MRNAIFRLLATLLIGGLVMTGCGVVDWLNPATRSLPSTGWEEGLGPDGLNSGMLAGDEEQGCVWLVHSNDRRTSLAWPQGYSLHTRDMNVLDAHNRVVASVGEHVELAGGVSPSVDAGRCDVGGETFAVVKVVSDQ